MTITWEQGAQTGAAFLLALLAWWLVAWQGKRAVERLSKNTDKQHAGEHEKRIKTLWAILRRMVQVVLMLIVGVTVALIWGIPMTPFVAVGTTLGVAIGFGGQSLVSDVIAGFLIISEHQFNIGDVVSVGGVSGTVEDVRLRVTVLRNLDGVVHYIPNGDIKVASNFTQGHSRVVIDIGIGYECDVDQSLAVLKDELESVASDDRWVTQPIVEILGVNQLGDSAVVLRGLLTTHPNDRWAIKRESLRRMKGRFDAEGISIPYQQVTVHFSGQMPDSESKI